MSAPIQANASANLATADVPPVELVPPVETATPNYTCAHCGQKSWHMGGRPKCVYCGKLAS